MRILPGRGLDSVAFGASRAAVVAAFGQPDRTFVDPYWDDDDEREELEYWSQRISFRFYDRDRLGWIETENRKVSLLSGPVINREITDVARELEDAGFGSPEVEDHGPSLSYFWDACWLELEVHYGRVVRLRIGVPFENGEDYAWPEG